ncbi:hypothetical protein OK18_05980 [Chryseobacterium gallinarum]|uniref:DUF4402 domain-containing protein n=1 Tax=Chryseobacterium gallinarum TaxID=1324352 RepID=A0A0G3M2L3_CHRGL|nr:hypothetical protein [Chryseobacterium gallinarum]AKK72248.1 hypothetical protein OK18_05980 [Chryseobacterium gallinarum]
MKTSSFLTKIFIKKYIYSILLIISSWLQAQTVTVSGNWAADIPSITEAGTNYTGIYNNTLNNQITLSGSLPDSFIKLLSSSGAKITMHYTTNAWNNSLGLSAKRSGGTTSITGVCVACSASINGGDVNYIPILQATDVTLLTITFSGLLGLGNSINFSGIRLLLQLSGVSVTIPATTYSARIVFTVVAN